jgi:hypothetical protein
MDCWEYDAIHFFYGNTKGTMDRDYRLEFSDGTSIVGLDNILNTYGRNGWDLVHFHEQNGNRFVAIFKRKMT